MAGAAASAAAEMGRKVSRTCPAVRPSGRKVVASGDDAFWVFEPIAWFHATGETTTTD
jgi:hypothetical protein